MSVRFELRCVKCDNLMRYDADILNRHNVMDWWCWECELNVVTVNLTNTLIFKDGLPYEASDD
jgi:hypothetical protein